MLEWIEINEEDQHRRSPNPGPASQKADRTVLSDLAGATGQSLAVGRHQSSDGSQCLLPRISGQPQRPFRWLVRNRRRRSCCLSSLWTGADLRDLPPPHALEKLAPVVQATASHPPDGRLVAPCTAGKPGDRRLSWSAHRTAARRGNFALQGFRPGPPRTSPGTAILRRGFQGRVNWPDPESQHPPHPHRASLLCFHTITSKRST